MSETTRSMTPEKVSSNPNWLINEVPNNKINYVLSNKPRFYNINFICLHFSRQLGV